MKMRDPPEGEVRITVVDRIFTDQHNPLGDDSLGPYFFHVYEQYAFSKGHFILHARTLETWFQLRIGVDCRVKVDSNGNIVEILGAS